VPKPAGLTKLPFRGRVIVELAEPIKGVDGEYKMDVVATFVALGNALFRVLIEYKRNSNPID
jgi:hypothetical protein